MAALLHTTPFVRRTRLRVPGAVAALIAALPWSACRPAETPSCVGIDDLVLINGEVITVDHAGTIADSIHVRNGRIVSVDRGATDFWGCGQVIDLGGRTVIPGLIDSHVHFLRAGTRPGHDLREIEFTYSIPELLEAIRERAAEVPEGDFITAIGGFVIPQFKEGRLPTLAELDEAAPRHGVLLRGGLLEPAVTNSVGRTLFEAHGVRVEPDGQLQSGHAADAPANAAFAILNTEIDFDHRVEQTARAIGIANQMGLTAVVDVAGRPEPGPSYFDHLGTYDIIREVFRRGEPTLRVRAVMPSWDTGPDNAGLRGRITFNFMNSGDEWFRVVGVGEEVVLRAREGPDVTPQNLEGAYRLAAQRGWTLTQHSISPRENEEQLDLIERVDALYPVADLRWTLAHVPDLSPKSIERLRALGMGVAVQNGYHFAPELASQPAGPAFRTLVDSGLPVAAGSDGTNVFPMNPWPGLYYMVTGEDVSGDVINEGQQISRMEALRLYTADAAWLSYDEALLGSLEVGKAGDLVVLDRDYLTIPSEQIKRVTPLLTVIDGRVVHGDPADL